MVGWNITRYQQYVTVRGMKMNNLADLESLICDDIDTCCAGFGRTPAKDDRFVIALCQIIVDRFKEFEDE